MLLYLPTLPKLNLPLPTLRPLLEVFDFGDPDRVGGAGHDGERNHREKGVEAIVALDVFALHARRIRCVEVVIGLAEGARGAEAANLAAGPGAALAVMLSSEARVDLIAEFIEPVVSALDLHCVDRDALLRTRRAFWALVALDRVSPRRVGLERRVRARRVVESPHA